MILAEQRTKRQKSLTPYLSFVGYLAPQRPQCLRRSNGVCSGWKEAGPCVTQKQEVALGEEPW